MRKNTIKKSAKKGEKFDVKEMIADKIIEAIEKEGALPWEKPWAFAYGSFVKRNGGLYSLLNCLLLEEAGEYVTWKQCTDEGGKVKKGAKSKMVIFYTKWIPEEEKKKAKEDPDYTPKSFPVMRYNYVFNVKDTTLEPKHFVEPKYPTKAKAVKDANALFDAYVAKSGVNFERHEQDEAFYRPATDTISLPLKKQFKSTGEYYSTLFHETVHSTGHKSRLDRLSKAVYANEGAYSREELVAEIGASAILNYLGIDTKKTRKNNAAYVKSWLKALKNDKGAIIDASAKAQKAFDFIVGKESEEETEAPKPKKQAKRRNKK